MASSSSSSTAHLRRTSQADSVSTINENGEPSFFVEALYPFNGTDTASLSFSKGDIIEVLTQLSSGWWDGVVWRHRERGWFPSNYVRRITDEEADLARAQLDLALDQIKPPDDPSSNQFLNHPSSSLHSSRLSAVSSIWDGHGQMHENETISTAQEIGTHLLNINPTESGTSDQDHTQLNVNQHLQSDSSRRPGNWVDWLPRVTSDGQIQYYNPSTGEMAMEMPSADNELDFEPLHLPTRLSTDHASPSSHSDPLAFLQSHGFGQEQLIRHGILPLDSDQTHIQNPFKLQNYGPSISHGRNTINPSNRLSTSTLTTSNSPPTDLPSTSSALEFEKSHNSSLLSVSSGNEKNHLSGSVHSSGLNDTSSHAPRASTSGQQKSTRAQSIAESAMRSSSSFSSSASVEPAAADMFFYSNRIKASLRNSLTLPPTPSLLQMRMEVDAAIDAIADVTTPYPDEFMANLMGSEMKHTPLDKAAFNALRDRLSSASLNLGARIRDILQASSQLDTAVLSVLRDSFASAGFASLLPGPMTPSTSTPISPYSMHLDSTMPVIPYHNRPASPSASLSTGSSSLVYPELKPVTRKIASTLSKLTLSTRALWGLLSSPPSDPPGPERFPQLGLSKSPDLADVAQAESNYRFMLQARYNLEQKLRSECKLGVNDLSSNIDLFFNNLELLLSESKAMTDPSYSLKTTVQTHHAPRHSVGHFHMPIEMTFLPAGAKGGNWKAAGFDTSAKFASPSFTSSTTIPPQRESRQLMALTSQPDIRLTSEWFSQQLSPMICQATDTSNAIMDLLPPEGEKVVNDQPFSHDKEQDWLESVFSRVSQLMDSIGVLMATTEMIDISSSSDMDLDQFLWLDAQRILARNMTTSALSWEDLNEALSRLHSSRHLVNEFHKAKQDIYHLIAKLSQVTHVLIPSVELCGSVPMASPAQPPSASPLFAIYTPLSEQSSLKSLSRTLSDLCLCLESLSSSTQSLVSEADAQSKMGSDFGYNKLVREFLTSSKASRRMSSQYASAVNIDRTTSRRDSRATNSSQGVGPAVGRVHSDSIPTSPTLQRHSRGIEEEQAENEVKNKTLSRDESTDSIPNHSHRQNLHPPSFISSSGTIDTIDRTSLDSAKRISLAAASVWSYSSSAKSEKSAEHPVNLKSSNQNNDIPSHVSDADRAESGSSRSPTRSRKLAKFFGEDTTCPVPVGAKINSAKPAFLMPDYGPDDISFNVDNQVRGGSLKGLVIKLTSHEGPDVPFLRVFLMTYRTFTTSHDFLDLLFERYHQQPPPDLSAEELKTWSDQKQKVIKIRVINVIRTWIESHLSDEDAESIIHRVAEFATRDMGDSSLSKQLALTCERRQSRGPSSKMMPVNPPGNPPPTIVPRNTRKLKFLDIDPLELARQLTLVESRLFCQIQVNECLGKAWPKEFAKEGTPYIKAMIDMSNALTRWVAETILSQPEQKKRANTIKHFILIAERCRNLNNFSTLMQIIAGLNSTPIYRLRRTWETIPHKTLTLFGQLGAVMSPTKNYATYRDTIRNMAPPCVPFVGVYLTDWTFIGDGNPDFLREKPHQINFNKRQKAAELIGQIQSYQSMPYQLTPVPVIVKFLEESLENPRDEKELYDMSLDIEPRERDDEKIARLLAESGFL